MLLSALKEAAAEQDSTLIQDDSVAAYFIRLLANHSKGEIDFIVDRFFKERGELVRKECIYAMSTAGNTVWLRSALCRVRSIEPLGAACTANGLAVFRDGGDSFS